MPNFDLLDTNRPDIARLLTAMVQAREAVDRRSWSQPQEHTSEDWWADVLADPRARRRRRLDMALRHDSYRLADERHETILVACSKCDWRAGYRREELVASYGEGFPCQRYSTSLRSRDAAASEMSGTPAASTTSSRSTERSNRALATALLDANPHVAHHKRPNLEGLLWQRRPFLVLKSKRGPG